MVNKIQSDIVQLSQIATSMQRRPDKITDKEFQKIVSLVKNKLKELEIFCNKEGFTPLTEKLKNDVKQVLTGLDKGFDIYSKLSNENERHEKIQELKDQILLVETEIATAPVKTKAEPPKIGLKIGFFCDIDAPDHNGAINWRIKKAVEYGFPFITTRSMLRCSNIEEKGFSGVRQKAQELEEILLKNHADWDIFQQNDPENGDELIVFLPKSLLSDKTEQEKLKALDFMTDGSLKKVTLMDALQGPQKKAKINSFFKLFVKDPQVEKLFYIAGHGDAKSVSALDANNYSEFLTFLDKQKCRGLVVTSCYSGGESSLMNIPEKGSKEETIPNYEDQAKDHAFITIVRSIGDFPTLAGQLAEENMSFLFDELSLFIESTEPTLARLRPVIENAEGGKSKVHANLIKVYFPHAADIPGGFRPLDERGLGYSLTYNVSKKSELLSQKPFAKPNVVIYVRGKSYLEVHPLVTHTPVMFKDNDAILLSMIPGNGHHFLKSVVLDNQNPKSFIQKTIDFHSQTELSAKKGFFIGSLSSSHTTFQEVVILISPESKIYAFKEGDYYYFSDGYSTQVISPLQHALILAHVEKVTRPSEAAVRSTSGGQENDQLFQETIRSPMFWTSPSNDAREFILSLEEECKSKTIQELLQNILSKKLTQDEKQDLLFMLINLNQEKLVLRIIEK